MLFLDTIIVGVDISKQTRSDSDTRKAVVEIPNVHNLTLCSVTYWRLEIRMSIIQSPISNVHVLHISWKSVSYANESNMNLAAV